MSSPKRVDQTRDSRPIQWQALIQAQRFTVQVGSAPLNGQGRIRSSQDAMITKLS